MENALFWFTRKMMAKIDGRDLQQLRFEEHNGQLKRLQPGHARPRDIRCAARRAGRAIRLASMLIRRAIA